MSALEFQNMDAFLRELHALPDVIQQKLAKGTAATGASVIRESIKARAPVWTGDVADGHPPPGTLKRAIYQTRLIGECTSTREVWLVGVKQGRNARNTKRGKGAASQDAYYARWVEYGHFTRAPKSAGSTKAARRRAMASGSQLIQGAHWVMARPFFRPGFEAKKGAAVQAMQDYLARNLPLAANSLRYLKAIGA
ncbi:Bacteriophage protein of unknown function (DUF646) [Burkholderiales bacterium JOSHI_001]|nr:Bacteriophage protein of unknown function (DUF646) [Burkholderiales bacterium JOSHI_001]